MIAGIDEAGRGPVIGPMVMAIVATDDEAALKKIGVRDSKELSPERREGLFVRIRELDHDIVELTPAEIDRAVQGDLDNLNMLEARTTALLIARLAGRVPLERVVIDSPARDTAAYERVVRKELRKLDEKGLFGDIGLQCEIKADANHPVVGAASILAKVTRDAAIARIALDHGDIGSGYPSDPLTQAFLSRHWREGHEFFRKSWQSYRRLAERSQPRLSDFGEHAEEHADVIKEFERLKEHGFAFQEPTNRYEVVRMRKGKTTIIRYATGKTVVQGPERDETLKLVEELR